MTLTNEIRFCVKYLIDHDVGLDDIPKIASGLKYFKRNYRFVEVRNDFFMDLARELREIWPSGKKMGQYEWRDSVGNLARRLELLWQVRDMPDVTIEQCVAVAKAYRAKHKDDITYMRVLKYFILKQINDLENNGKKKVLYDSPFADMLQDVSELETATAEADMLFNEASVSYGGELV